MLQVSLNLANSLLNNAGLKSMLENGRLYIYAGPVPSNADVPLDMAARHTEIAHIFSGGTAVGYGMTFDVPTDRQLVRNIASAWSTVAAFVGANAGASSLTATFFRTTVTTDDGTTDGTVGTTKKRLQGTIGLVGSGADLQLGVVTYAPSDPLTIGEFRIKAYTR